MSLAVADTHAIIWFAAGPQRKLGREARRLLSRCESGTAMVYVPTIALLEISEAMRRGKIRPQGSFSKWVSSLLARPGFLAVDLTVDVVLAAESLLAIPERADRVIAATALHLDCPLITRDPSIGRAANIETIW